MSSHSQVFSSLPLVLWNYYLQYLWYYDSSSWVAKISSTLRVLAFLFVLPAITLGMLDISSYIIARTLGVVDVAKASTTDKPVITRLTIPSIHIEDTSSSSPDPDSITSTADASNTTTPPDPSDTIAHDESNGFAELLGLDDSMFSNEKLSGVGVFSPATSRPPSPTLSRRKLIRESNSLGGELNILLQDHKLKTRRRPRRGTRSGVLDSEA